MQTAVLVLLKLMFLMYASRSFGKLLVGAEYSEFSPSNGNDRGAYMVLVDYDYTDKIGAAIRFSNEELASGQDYEKITIAPNYQSPTTSVLSSNSTTLKIMILPTLTATSSLLS